MCVSKKDQCARTKIGLVFTNADIHSWSQSNM